MIDKRIKFLLHYINLKSENEKGYIVIEAEEVILASPKKLLLDDETVTETIKVLQSLGYLTLKYNDGSSFCLSVTDKGKKPLNFDIKQESKGLLLIVLSSVIGSFLGSMIFYVIFR